MSDRAAILTSAAAAALGESVAAQRALPGCAPAVAALADQVLATLEGGGTVFWAGNGGSAAEAQHAAAELMGRFMRDRRPFRSLSLTVDTSALTAIANDYGYDRVFARQLQGLGHDGDLLIVMSTSGNSANLINALTAAHSLGMSTAALTGARGGAVAERANVVVRVPSEHTAHIQEMHLTVIHAVCGIVEDRLGGAPT